MITSPSLRATALLALLGTGSAFGAAYVGSAYEGFNYTPSTQITNVPAFSGGTGWNSTGDSSLANTTTWAAVLTSGTTRNTTAAGLDYNGAGYPSEVGVAATVAGSGSSGANVGRDFGQSVDSGTFYFSYLTQKTVDTVRTLNLSFFSGTNERLAIGQIANNTTLKNADGTVDTTTTPNQGHFAALVSNGQNNSGAYNGVYTSATPQSYTLNTTFLVVGKIEFNYSGVADRLTLYINPSSLSDEGALTPYLQFGVNDFGSISAFRIFAGGNQTSPSVFNASGGIFDEVRLGTTYNAVTGVAAVPEPSSFAALAGLAGLAFAASRRRRA